MKYESNWPVFFVFSLENYEWGELQNEPPWLKGQSSTLTCGTNF